MVDAKYFYEKWFLNEQKFTDVYLAQYGSKRETKGFPEFVDNIGEKTFFSFEYYNILGE